MYDTAHGGFFFHGISLPLANLFMPAAVYVQLSAA
jgi:hypothetical protein